MSIWGSIKKFFSERGLPGDKALHVFFSMLLTVGLVMLARSNDHHPLNGVLVAFIIGLVKEMFDLMRHRGWDWKDILANAIGCSVGMVMTEAWVL